MLYPYKDWMQLSHACEEKCRALQQAAYTEDPEDGLHGEEALELQRAGREQIVQITLVYVIVPSLGCIYRVIESLRIALFLIQFVGFAHILCLCGIRKLRQVNLVFGMHKYFSGHMHYYLQ